MALLQRLKMAAATESATSDSGGETKHLATTEPVLQSQSSNLSERKKSIAPAIAPPKPAQGPSLLGMLASRRFAKKMGKKFHTRTSSQMTSQVQQEPTYKMSPDCKFDPIKVEKIIEKVLNGRLGGMRYSPKFSCNMMKVVSDEIKDKVKELKFERYKIVCVLVLGEPRDQCAIVSSRCAWDQKLDNFATYTFQSSQLWCNATVYGLYKE
ncbi:hypothetical protein KUTeg_016624 [Tegillarca granosa]|uniref:Uncharacterized protein n=1 Tax=Tegillarca granosa TaxID=220873 RepID=A0ABQ9ELD2_TEGGR|nr:hypothetical protein KUTeg_016624 [Tegillarca granosa]